MRHRQYGSPLPLLFTSLAYLKKWDLLGRYLGGTWEERFRFTFVTSLLSNRYQSEVLSKTKRSSIEDLSNIYRTSIEDLSKTYRTSIEEGVKRERRGSREGAEEEFGYKVTKFRSLIFTFLVVSVI